MEWLQLFYSSYYDVKRTFEFGRVTRPHEADCCLQSPMSVAIWPAETDCWLISPASMSMKI